MRFVLGFAALLALMPSSGLALDKQMKGLTCEGRFDNCGFVFLGPLLYNPTYAAAPDNTGLTLLRMGLHSDQNLHHRLLGLSLDLNSFTDREGEGFYKPSDLDLIVGLLSHPRPWLELATHYERDGALGAGAMTSQPDPSGVRIPTRRSDYSQSYVDMAARVSHEHDFGARTLSLQGGLGLFVYNPSYAAHPDNSGLALFRYLFHEEFELLPDWLTVKLDENFFTDRCANGAAVAAPSELDFVVELALRPPKAHGAGVSLAFERDMPVVGDAAPGCGQPASILHTQQYVSLLFSWQWSIAARR